MMLNLPYEAKCPSSVAIDKSQVYHLVFLYRSFFYTVSSKSTCWPYYETSFRADVRAKNIAEILAYIQLFIFSTMSHLKAPA